MNGPKIVTGIVFLSLMSVGCKAKFTTRNAPTSAPTSFSGPKIPPPPDMGVVDPGTPAQRPPGPTVTPRTPGPSVPPLPTPASPNHTGPIVPQVIDPTIGCPTSGDGSIDPRRALQRKTIVFKKGRQMIWRKNCDGQVYSKQWENITQATSQKIRIRPSTRSGGVQTMMVINRTTCDSNVQSSQLRANAQGEYVISVSTSASNSAMFVKPGQNLIDYEIPGGEKGTLVLTVRINSRSEDCVVIRDRGCAPSREASWSDQVFTNGN